MPDEAKLPTREELARLPRWACVAFAARCAKRVRPLFDLAWPAADLRHREAVDTAIRVAAAAAAAAAVYIDDAVQAAKAARVIADDDATCRLDRFAARDVAAAAAYAAYAAHAAEDADRRAAHSAFQAAEAALGAAARTAGTFSGPVSRAMRQDYRLLITNAARWTDQTPVSEGFFGPVWPEGEPPGLGRRKESSHEVAGKLEPAAGPTPDDELVLQVEVPEGASDEDVVKFVKDLADKLDTLHRAQGGHGLKIERLEATDDASVPEEVRQ